MAINIHYAYQICDIANREINNRYCNTDRTTLSKKSFRSFLDSVEICAKKHPVFKHTIRVFSDRSTKDLLDFINFCIKNNNFKNITIDVQHLDAPGISNSILECFKWMQLQGKDFVYQVQDDYLFIPSCITEMIELQLQFKAEMNEYCIVSPFNDNWLWMTQYRNKSTPRAIICSPYRYWIQYYDMSCSFLTHHSIFSQHWDFYHEFFNLLDETLEKKTKNLENHSLNYMLTRRGVLGLVPVNILAFHIQSELEKDPYIDWKPYWDNVCIENNTSL